MNLLGKEPMSATAGVTNLRCKMGVFPRGLPVHSPLPGSEIRDQHWADQASLGAQWYPPTMQEMQVQSLGQEDPLEKKMATHASIHGQRATVHGVPKSQTCSSD